MILQYVFWVSLQLFFCLFNLWNFCTQNNCQKKIKQKFRKRGINIGGKQAWDIEIHDQRFFSKVALDAGIGIVESYVEGWWDPNDMSKFCDKLLSEWSRLTCRTDASKWRDIWIYLYNKTFYLHSSVAKPPRLCGSKLCVVLLDWVTTWKETCNNCDDHNNKLEDFLRKKESPFAKIVQRTDATSIHAEYARCLVNLKDLRKMGLHNSDAVEAWIKNFETPKLKKTYDDEFYRMWHFYLHTIAAAFRLQRCHH